MTLRRYLPSTDRRAEILHHALKLAKRDGYRHVTREAIATASQCAPSLVTCYLGTRDEMQAAIMHEAIQTRCLRVVAQGLVDGRYALHIAPELKKQALAAV